MGRPYVRVLAFVCDVNDQNDHWTVTSNSRRSVSNYGALQ